MKFKTRKKYHQCKQTLIICTILRYSQNSLASRIQTSCKPAVMTGTAVVTKTSTQTDRLLTGKHVTFCGSRITRLYMKLDITKLGIYVNIFIMDG